MKPDFDHIRKLFDIYYDGDNNDMATAARNELISLLPKSLFTELEGIEFGPKEYEEFERTFREFYSQQESPDETGDNPNDLLPFAGFEKYSLDAWGRPHVMGGQGQKRGPLAVIRQWRPRKGQKPRFIFGYNLYLKGKRVFRSAMTCAIARSNAERSLEHAQYWADRNAGRLPRDMDTGEK